MVILVTSSPCSSASLRDFTLFQNFLRSPHCVLAHAGSRMGAYTGTYMGHPMDSGYPPVLIITVQDQPQKWVLKGVPIV